MSHRPAFPPAYLALALALALALSACNFPGAPSNAVPLYIPPVGKTGTPAPTATPDPAGWIQLGAEVRVGGLFSFQPVATWDVSGVPMTLELFNSKASQSNAEETLFFSLASEPAGENPTAAACIDTLLNRMNTDLPAFDADDPHMVLIQGAGGLESNLTGTIFDRPMVGRLAVFYPDGRCFSLLGLAAAEDAPALWSRSGSYAFEKLLNSLKFLNSGAETQPSCQPSTDPTYGFSPENPLRVGTVNIYDGVSRMQAVLENLRGPAGQQLDYERKLPTYNKDGVIVDVYKVSYAGLAEPIKLYFTIYDWQTPLAPVGFTCEAPFPPSQP